MTHNEIQTSFGLSNIYCPIGRVEPAQGETGDDTITISIILMLCKNKVDHKKNISNVRTTEGTMGLSPAACS